MMTILVDILKWTIDPFPCHDVDDDYEGKTWIHLRETTKEKISPLKMSQENLYYWSVESGGERRIEVERWTESLHKDRHNNDNKNSNKSHNIRRAWPGQKKNILETSLCTNSGQIYTHFCLSLAPLTFPYLYSDQSCQEAEWAWGLSIAPWWEWLCGGNR